MSAFETEICRVIRSIPPGEVMTYGEVAEEAGRPGAARAVGNILRTTGESLPWWRVVGAGWRIQTGERQARLLESEGWSVDRKRLRRADAPYSSG